METDPVLQTFIIESTEKVQEMESALLQLETSPEDEDTINALFRAAHTIKGSAGVVGIDNVEKFTHTVENVLEKVRLGEIRVTADLIGLLLRCCDHIGHLLESLSAGKDPEENPELKTEGQAIAGELSAYLAVEGQGISAEPDKETTAQGSAPETLTWHISLRFGRDVLRDGMDPISFISYLSKLGEITGLTTLTDAMPPAQEMDPESCYLGFEIDFRSDAGRQAIEDVFEFVQEDCEINIAPLHGNKPSRKAADTAAGKQTQTRESGSKVGGTIRVDTDKLDQLINMVGELVIANANINQQAKRIGDNSLLESAFALSRLVEDIRDRAMKVRMVPIGETFNRFRRTVRDFSRSTGKDIRLLISGSETELDKGVIEKIGDPLMHLIRNSADHGIEERDVRLALNKPENGLIHLNAYQETGSIVIEISDDGSGLNREKILKKAVERGIISPGQELSDREINNLIFEPGFSTAQKVTNVSGRGVGMDVVKRNIEALRGSVEVESREGKGTTVRIRLPLTMAIIDGFMVKAGASFYIIPLDMLDECLEMSDEEKHLSFKRNYFSLRGTVLPFLRLRDIFNEPDGGNQREHMVVIRYAGGKTGLVVDELHGEVQVVIKSLGRVYRDVKGISGATILGDGTVALILDVPGLVRNGTRKRRSGL
ncbi:MAG: chemotaxis protein CheA [Deferribacteres bacterium]|nr:chemotaxis protein CheA [Deferribacteres bacterium]